MPVGRNLPFASSPGQASRLSSRRSNVLLTISESCEVVCPLKSYQGCCLRY